ncbi:MAG: hypothetical protein GY711_24930 [bacterium]|nr:hypothetical protein [bacterium]
MSAPGFRTVERALTVQALEAVRLDVELDRL